MANRALDQALPLSLKKHVYDERKAKDCLSERMSAASSHDSFYDTMSDFHGDSIDGNLSELSAFLSEEEINKSLDIAREAFSGPSSVDPAQGHRLKTCHNNPPGNRSYKEVKLSNSTSDSSRKRENIMNKQGRAIAPNKPGNANVKGMISPLLSMTTSPSIIKTLQAQKASKLQGKSGSYTLPIPKARAKSINREVNAQTDVAQKAATFIEELSAIFRETNKARDRRPNGDSSSPDSGYLSPKKENTIVVNPTTNESETIFQEKNKARDRHPNGDSSSPDSGYLSPKKENTIVINPTINESKTIPQTEHNTMEVISVKEETPNKTEHKNKPPEEEKAHSQANKSYTPPSAARFTQKLKSQEVAEGSRVRLECIVTGNPFPEVRWFCEGRELHNTPDINISSESDGLQVLIIVEAFEDDTGRYTCVASNRLGSDTTSAEVFVEGASSSDSDSDGFTYIPKQGAMPQAQKKTTSVSLTIGPSSPKCGITTAVMQPISIPIHQVHSPTSYLCRQDGSSSASSAPPSFTKELQSLTASEGQVVVLECRVKGTPPVNVKWFRQGTEIQDSPDFRILQKKPRCASEPEEICTLVIAETFPEDAGTFTCTARNDYGSVTCSAKLTVLSANNERTRSDVSSGEISGYGFQKHSSPSPIAAKSSGLEMPSKNTPESFQPSNHDSKPNMERCHLQLNTLERKTNGIHANNGVNGVNSNQDSKFHGPTSPTTLASPTKEPPPVPSKPKLDSQTLLQLQNQIRHEKESAASKQQASLQQSTPPSPSFPPPPSFQELEASQFISSPVQMSVLNSHSSPAMQPASSFNYARPKQFIAAQNMSSAPGYVTPSSGSSTSSIPSPLSPSTPQNQFNRIPVQPFSQPFAPEGEQFWSPTSSSPPPPPPPVISPTATYSVQDSFPLPPPPPPLPVSSTSYSPSQSPTTRGSGSSHNPAAFLSSMLPSQPSPVSFNDLGLPKGVMPPGFPKKVGRTARIASDEEIQGTKDAVIQDLERKLRFKDELLNNGQPKLTYEEKMARRLLGADSAATVFNLQESEDDSNTQEYKVSSFDQRLISEIEYRLERSPVEESDDEVEHGDEFGEDGSPPQFETKLRHFKIYEGMPATFTCMVTGNPQPKIYWFKDGKQISKRSEHYKIQREPDGTCSLHTSAASLDDDGNYTIMAANPQGRVSCTGRLMVQAVNQRGRSNRTPTSQPHIRRPRSRSRDSGEENEPIQERFFRPHFLQAPGDLIVQEGKLCRMDCKVSGLPTPDLSWQLNGRPVRPDNNHKMLVRENGVHSLIIEPVTSRDAGIYTCVASNRAGQNSFSLELIVAARDAHKPPVFLEKLQNTGVAEGYPVRLECRVSGSPPPQIFWKKENESLTYNTDRVSMHQDNYGYLCLLIQGTTKEDAGWYTVSAKNEAGIVSCTARLDIHTQWQQSHTPKTRKVRPSASRYAALCDQGLDIKAAFMPEANPVHLQPALIESDDL
ncbi:palladin isoform X1 [Hyperolius riggenbachi]|uniref:palladin isoform X1 n=1 Tax=Hyperolius riggenbachi TaxID=752182 RepID=UPI0035A2836F